jgi:hypothetical protein
MNVGERKKGERIRQREREFHDRLLPFPDRGLESAVTRLDSSTNTLYGHGEMLMTSEPLLILTSGPPRGNLQPQAWFGMFNVTLTVDTAPAPSGCRVWRDWGSGGCCFVGHMACEFLFSFLLSLLLKMSGRWKDKGFLL